MEFLKEIFSARGWHWTFVKIGVATLSLGALLYWLDWQEISTSFERINPAIFALAVLLLLPENVLLALRWHFIVRSDLPLPILEHTRRFFISVFINLFTPANIGGDLYRFLNLRKMSKNNWQMAGLLLQEKTVGITGYAIFYLACFISYLLTTNTNEATLAEIYWLGAVCFALGLSSFYASQIILGILRHKLPFLHRTSSTKFGEMTVIGLGIGQISKILRLQSLSLWTCSLWTLSILLIAWDLEMNVKFAVLGMAGILTDIVRQIPVSIQGIGVREGTFAMLLWTMEFSLEQGFVLGLASYLAATVAVAVVGGIAFIMPVYANKPATPNK